MEKKDYIAYPKSNGYRSLHLIIRFTTDDLKDITAEIQLRTIALDFWASCNTYYITWYYWYFRKEKFIEELRNKGNQEAFYEEIIKKMAEL